MENLFHSFVAIACALVLLISLPQFHKMWDRQDMRDRSFVRLILWVILFCINDAVWWVLAKEFPDQTTLLFACSTVYHGAAAITAYLWLSYTLYYLGKRVKYASVLRIVAMVLVAIQFGLLLLNIPNSFLFSVNNAVLYQETSAMRFLFCSQYATYIIIALLCLFKMKSGTPKDRRKFLAMFLCVLAPICCGVLQMLSPLSPFYVIGYMLGCCVIFTHVVLHMTKVSTYQQDNAIMAALSADFDMICYIDIQRNEARFQTMSPKFQKILDEKVDKNQTNLQKLDQFLKTIVVPEDLPEIIKEGSCEQAVNSLSQDVSYTIRVRVRIDDTTEFYEMKVVHDKDNRLAGCVLGMHNITHVELIKEETEKLKNDLKKTTIIANRDPLTGVGNRAAFNQKTEDLLNEINKGKLVKFAIIECDLNNLKLVNDLLGHEEGDSFIKKNCRVFCETFKHSPVYRIGGDEFVIIAQGSDYDDRDALMDKLRSQQEPNDPVKADKVSFAAGIAEYNPQIDESVADVLKRADSFMYINKKHIKKREPVQEAWE